MNKGIQRFKCKECGRTFNLIHKTAIHGLHKKKLVPKYLEALHKGMSVRKAAAYTGIAVSTAFFWRHKFLSAPSKEQQESIQHKIAATKIIKTPFSNKGAKKSPLIKKQDTVSLLIKDNNKLTIKILPQKKTVLEITKTISKLFPQTPHLTFSPQSLLTRSSRHIKIMPIFEKSIKKHFIDLAEKTEKDLFDWMQKFRGVATKYLQNYWYWYIEQLSYFNNELEFKLACSRS